MRVPPLKLSHGDCANTGVAAVEADRGEERDELEQRARRRVRRQQLVRRVGEHDEADRLVRVDDPAQRRRDPLVHRPGDARRHVEHDARPSSRLTEAPRRGPCRPSGRARTMPASVAAECGGEEHAPADVRSIGGRSSCRSASSTGSRRSIGREPHVAAPLLARLLGERLDFLVLRHARRPRELVRGLRELVDGGHDAELARRRARTPCAAVSRRRARAPTRAARARARASSPRATRRSRRAAAARGTSARALRARRPPRGRRARARARRGARGETRNVGAATGASRYCQSYLRVVQERRRDRRADLRDSTSPSATSR